MSDHILAFMSHFDEILGKRENFYISFIRNNNIFFGCLCGKPFLSISVMGSNVTIGANMPVQPVSADFGFTFNLNGAAFGSPTRIIIPKHFHRRGVRRTVVLDGVKNFSSFKSYIVIELCRPDSIYQIDYMANIIVTKVAKGIRVCNNEVHARYDVEIDLLKYAIGEWLRKRDSIIPK